MTPLKVNGTLVGVLDIDSTVYSRFDNEDQTGLVALTDGLCEVLAGSDIEKFIQLSRS